MSHGGGRGPKIGQKYVTYYLNGPLKLSHPKRVKQVVLKDVMFYAKKTARVAYFKGLWKKCRHRKPSYWSSLKPKSLADSEWEIIEGHQRSLTPLREKNSLYKNNDFKGKKPFFSFTFFVKS